MENGVYNLPWTHGNNPNGWIEPTTYCQLKCPHCYRGCDRNDHKPTHRDLEELKREVDRFIKERNVETISISGGEPLLYPYLDELIRYIKRKELKIMIFTNGILLDINRLQKFKEMGVTQILLHIDQYQKRNGISSQEEVNKLKAGYCDLFRSVKGVSLGFIEPLTSLDNLEEILAFYRRNNDIISLVDFTIATETYNAEIDKDNHGLTPAIVSEKIKEMYGIEYSFKIKKALTEDFAWLGGAVVFLEGNLLGSIDGDVVKYVHEEFYKKNGRYIFIDNNFPSTIKSVWKFLTNKSLRRIALNFLKQKNKGKIYSQVILIVVPPELKADKFNICSSCPDAMYYKGKLIPSCILGRIDRDMCKNYKYYCDNY